MGMSLDIRVEPGQLAEIRRLLADVPNGIPRVIVRAVNKVGAAARTQIVRAVVAVVNLKSSDVRNRNVLLTNANFSNLTAWLRISGRRIPILSWGARQTGRGVSYAIRRGQRQLLPSAFIATMKSRHRMAAVRTEPRVATAGRRAYSPIGGVRRHGLPIAERFGPSVPAVVEGIGELSQSVLDAKISADLAGESETQVALILQQGRRG